MDYVILVLFALVAAAGVVLAVFQLPGIWLILAATAGYDWLYDWQRFGWKWLAALGLMAVCAEAFDVLAGMVAARRAGASRRAAVGALIGGFLGMILLTLPIPIPGLGAIIGGVLGCFFGALAAELSLNKDVKTGTKVGLFAATGRVVGLVTKTSTAIVIAGAVLSIALMSMW